MPANHPMPLKAGCQTYTWEMLGDKWTGGPDELLAAIAAAGYSGIEITDTMIGNYASRPKAFADALRSHGLTLVAFAQGSASGFTEPAAFARELEDVERGLAFAAGFPGALLSLGSATIVSPGGVEEKFQAAAAVYNAAGERGRRAGVAVAVHPSSHHNTLLRLRGDYDRIMGLTDPSLVGWVPDTGHILRGFQDIMDTIRTYLGRVRYLHLKDVDAQGRWAMLGSGVCDTEAVVSLVTTGPNFNGWVVLEEESDAAATDPVAAVRANRATIGGILGDRLQV